MSRITLGRALGIVGVFAVGCAAMRVGTIQGERLVFSVALMLHASALVGTLFRRGRSPEWVGFTVFGWAFFLAVTTTVFEGHSGNTYLVAADLSDAAFDRLYPPHPVPVVDGVALAEEPDKMTASDRAIQVFKDYAARVDDRDTRRRHSGAIADLLGSVAAAVVGAAAGRMLRPNSPARGRRPRNVRRRRPRRARPRRAGPSEPLS